MALLEFIGYLPIGKGRSVCAVLGQNRIFASENSRQNSRSYAPSDCRSVTTAVSTDPKTAAVYPRQNLPSLILRSIKAALLEGTLPSCSSPPTLILHSGGVNVQPPPHSLFKVSDGDEKRFLTQRIYLNSFIFKLNTSHFSHTFEFIF